MQDSNLRPGAQMLWDGALAMLTRLGHKELGLNHFLLALLERHGPMAESMASGLSAQDTLRRVRASLEKGEIGAPVVPESLLAEIARHAAASGKASASERDLAAVVLEKAGWTLLVEPAPSGSGRTQPATRPAEPPAEPDEAVAPAAEYHPRARHPTPLLEKFGRDLCREALDGKLSPVLGRGAELQAVMETLCRWTKRNPLLVGPAGVGKTAIVEALAQRVVTGKVPLPLRGLRLFALQASALVSGASAIGQLEERMRAVVQEASQEGIVLFIDEVHTIVGSGGIRQVSDLGSLLKPALAKGELACIGATTDAEYASFIEQDRALERRFQPLRVQELSADATLEILRSLAERALREQKITLPGESLEIILLLAEGHLRNRHFPDKAIDILEQCMAYALIQGLGTVTPAVVQNVVQRMVGIPLDVGVVLSERLAGLRERLTLEAFCPEAAAEQLAQRLEIAMRGLDVSPLRPNAVVLVVGAPGARTELSAQVLAEALYGSRERLIELDMARFTHAADVTWLTGAPPGYVGHDQALELHLRLSQQPWSVVLLRNVEASHPQAQEVLAQAFRSGFFVDARGRRVYLSDAVVVLTAGGEAAASRPLGFVVRERDQREAEQAAGDLGLAPDLEAEVDVRWRPERPTAGRVCSWLGRWVAPALSERYRRQGLELVWDASALRWLAEEIEKAGDLALGERLVEERVLPLLVPFLSQRARLRLFWSGDGGVQITREEGG